eukprot:SAG31_NODE_16453_length_708_cov_1.684729_1_plen_185_part_00
MRERLGAHAAARARTYSCVHAHAARAYNFKISISDYQYPTSAPRDHFTHGATTLNGTTALPLPSALGWPPPGTSIWLSCHDMLLALVVTALAAQAAPLAPGKDAGSTGATTAEQVAGAAQQLRGDATIAATLQTVQVCRDGAERALASLGFETALDLQLLAGGPEAVELMATLRAGGELGIADR